MPSSPGLYAGLVVSLISYFLSTVRRSDCISTIDKSSSLVCIFFSKTFWVPFFFSSRSAISWAFIAIRNAVCGKIASRYPSFPNRFTSSSGDFPNSVIFASNGARTCRANSANSSSDRSAQGKSRPLPRLQVSLLPSRQRHQTPPPRHRFAPQSQISPGPAPMPPT